MFGDGFIYTFKYLRGLIGERVGADTQMNVRSSNFQITKENITQISVEILTCMQSQVLAMLVKNFQDQT
jgi:hypothetical protein